MALTDEHWDCIMNRALPLLSKRTTKLRVAENEAAMAAFKAGRKASRVAAESFEDDPSEAKRDAAQAAHNALQPLADAVETSRAKVAKLSNALGQVEMFKENWELLSDGPNLATWCDVEELAEAEADLAEQEAAVAKARAQHEAKRASRG